MVGRLAKAWKWFSSPSTKTIGPICQLLNDQFAEFTEFTNSPNYFYAFIKTWAIGVGWVGRAWKGSGESETMVSANSPVGRQGTGDSRGRHWPDGHVDWVNGWGVRWGFTAEIQSICDNCSVVFKPILTFLPFLFLKVGSPGGLFTGYFALHIPILLPCVIGLALHLSSFPLSVWSDIKSLSFSPVEL